MNRQIINCPSCGAEMFGGWTPVERWASVNFREKFKQWKVEKGIESEAVISFELRIWDKCAKLKNK